MAMDLIQDELAEMGEANEKERKISYKADVDKALLDSEDGYHTRWIDRLPGNMGKGLYRAGLNTIEAVDDFAEANPGQTDAGPTFRESFPELLDSAHAFADRMEEDNSTADEITQFMTQFTIPFLGYAKLANYLVKGGKMVKGAKLLAADQAAAATALAPDEGRFMDLLAEGRQMDNRFGRILERASPDGSMLNSFIDTMTEREGDSRAMGRFKNAVDSNIGFVALGGLFKAVAWGARRTKSAITDRIRIGFDDIVAPDGPKPEKAFHGTPEKFDTFDVNKINPNDPDDVVNGFWFTSSKKEAKDWQEFPWGRPNTAAGEGQVMEATIDLAKPATREDVSKAARKVTEAGLPGSVQDNTRKALVEDGFDGFVRTDVSVDKAAFAKDGTVAIDKSGRKLVDEGVEGVGLYEKDGSYVTGYADIDDAASQLVEKVTVVFDPARIGKPKPKAGVAVVGAGAAAVAAEEISNRSRK